LLTVSLISHSVLASCDPKSNEHVYKSTSYNPPRYVYSIDCHIEFGRLIEVEKKRKEQVDHLEKSITLKDLAINTSNKRVELWKKTTYKIEDKLVRLEKNNNRLKWMYFGLGILIMAGATYGASKLNKE
jgi:hypothetical protein